MKCDNMVTWQERKKRGKTIQRVYFIISWLQRDVQGMKVPEGAEKCGGNIICKIELANDGSGCCCCSPGYIEIYYICDRCGGRHGTPELSTDISSVSKIVTEAIDKIPKKKLSEMKKAVADAERKHQKEMEKFMKIHSSK